jgi:hypothetical protein
LVFSPKLNFALNVCGAWSSVSNCAMPHHLYIGLPV